MQIQRAREKAPEDRGAEGLSSVAEDELQAGDRDEFEY
jgi:hypothetical protein